MEKKRLRYRLWDSGVRILLPDGSEIAVGAGGVFEVDSAFVGRLLKTSDGLDDPRFEEAGE
ncbi:MAG: hypothetical protein HYU39_04640 [Thaumarchaeota archaeon]|nr:hypothetical protein [Nitrososphaerota archaeon]